MLNDFIGFTVLGAIALLPLFWRVWRDRAVERALRVRADVDGAVRRALGGDSFIAVDVTPRLLGRPGQVILSTPSGWGDLVQLALPSVLDRVPSNYELVVRPGDRPPGHAEEGERHIVHATA
jgi:hypothetical protein